MEYNLDQKPFVPEGASRFWPFILGVNSYCPPKKDSKKSIIDGFFEALFRNQKDQPREFWKDLPKEQIESFMKIEGAGKEHPSRIFAASLIRKNESVLDVGCGVAVNYETILHLKKECDYKGIDSSAPAIEMAKKAYPKASFEVVNACGILDHFKESRFDVVFVRHVLEHLPDFEEAMLQAASVSKRIAIFTFFLSPRNLPLGIRKLNPRIDPPFFTYIYSHGAIRKCLNRNKLSYLWIKNVGMSRAGWLGNETNTLLIVSKSADEISRVKEEILKINPQ